MKRSILCEEGRPANAVYDYYCYYWYYNIIFYRKVPSIQAEQRAKQKPKFDQVTGG